MNEWNDTAFWNEKDREKEFLANIDSIFDSAIHSAGKLEKMKGMEENDIRKDLVAASQTVRFIESFSSPTRPEEEEQTKIDRTAATQLIEWNLGHLEFTNPARIGKLSFQLGTAN